VCYPEIKTTHAWLLIFMATLYNKIFLGYQPCQLLKWRKNQRFKDHLCPRLQGTDVSGESVGAIYKPARVPRSCWCASQWELLVGVKSLLLHSPCNLAYWQVNPVDSNLPIWFKFCSGPSTGFLAKILGIYTQLLLCNTFLSSNFFNTGL
jgi:hypothetical protein